MASKKSLRTNPFLAYRDPDSGQWVTVVPSPAPKPDIFTQRPPQTIRIVEPEAFHQISLRLT